MHPNAATIQRFYRAFERLDPDTMAACYAENVAFDDPVFSLQGKRDTMGMWRMLCESVTRAGREAWSLQASDIAADATAGRAHWQARYRFGATGRLVHNRIDALFVFDAQGQIERHHDRFDFGAWAAQALGLPGRLLGWTPWLRRRVQAQAETGLRRFLAVRA